MFTTHGQLLQRLVAQAHLDAPWGLEIVNGQFWLGNFGDRRINVYNSANGSFLGRPRDILGIPLDFDGLWGLLMEDGVVYFTAGVVDENHRILGVIF